MRTRKKSARLTCVYLTRYTVKSNELIRKVSKTPWCVEHKSLKNVENFTFHEWLSVDCQSATMGQTQIKIHARM